MRALGVDDHLYSAPLHHFVAVLCVIEPHRILQPRTAAVFHEDAQAIRRVWLLADEDLELRKSGISDVNHARKLGRAPDRAKWQVMGGIMTGVIKSESGARAQAKGLKQASPGQNMGGASPREAGLG